MSKDNVMYLIDHQDELPERAYTTLPSNKAEVIIVVNGESGYYHFQTYDTPELAIDTAKFCNEKLGVTEDEEIALKILSMRKR